MSTSENMSGMKNNLKELLLSADVRIDGDRPWDIQVHNEGFYRRVVRELTVGLGESYMDGWWDCQSLDQFFYHILSSHLDEKVKRNPSIIFSHLLGRLINVQSRVRLKKGIAETYDKGIELYMSFLDPYNQYTCGYFKDTDDLAKAQELKLDLICRKLNISRRIACWISAAGGEGSRNLLRKDRVQSHRHQHFPATAGVREKILFGE